MTTHAQRFMVLWHTQGRGITARSVAKRIDPSVTRFVQPFEVVYNFSDGSAVRSNGRGHYYVGNPHNDNHATLPHPPNRN